MSKRPKVTKFNVKNRKKYVGNPDNVISRSGWERRIMKEFDTNPLITQWASEEVVIPIFIAVRW